MNNHDYSYLPGTKRFPRRQAFRLKWDSTGQIGMVGQPKSQKIHVFIEVAHSTFHCPKFSDWLDLTIGKADTNVV